MPTSPTDTLLLFLDESGEPAGWRLLAGGETVARGDAAEPWPEAPRSVLAVPGEAVAIHWLALEPGLPQAQAAAAARLLLADAIAEPMAALHAAVGAPEAGRTPVAIVPNSRVAAWLDRAAALGLDPDAIVPTPMLLAPPAEGLAVRPRGAVGDYRGPAAAFALEPELAAQWPGAGAAVPVDDDSYEAGLAALAVAPPLDLRQGRFARLRGWTQAGGPLRRLGLLALVLALLSVAIQVAILMGYTFGADRLEAEARALGSGGAGPVGTGFSGPAAALFDAMRSTPNVELRRLEFRPDGMLAASLSADGVASLGALRARLEASGLRVEGEPVTGAGGGAVADFRMRAA